MIRLRSHVLSDDKDTYTQFAHACNQLGIELESSSVPQAKGRI
nr:MAG TPA: type II secretion system protein [Caudoviricetes sp.]